SRQWQRVSAVAEATPCPPFVPAKAGTQGSLHRGLSLSHWVPAFAGTNGLGKARMEILEPRPARRSLPLRRRHLALRSKLRARLQELLDDLGRGLGLTEEIALHLGAADVLQRFHLLLGLDAFRGRHHVEALREAGDRMHDGERLGRARDVLNERAVDLD